MTAKEYAKHSREELRQKFGDIGLKTDCENYSMRNGKDWCVVCNHDKERRCLPCVFGVCYFYSNKGEKNND